MSFGKEQHDLYSMHVLIMLLSVLEATEKNCFAVQVLRSADLFASGYHQCQSKESSVNMR